MSTIDLRTITLTDPDAVAHFGAGETVCIDDLPYTTACAVFGKPIVDDYLDHKARNIRAPVGYVKVVSIDRNTRALTLKTRGRK